MTDRMPPCHENLRSLFERALAEGRLAPSEEISARLLSAEERWRRVLEGTGRPSTRDDLRAVLASYCEATGVGELKARAWRINGDIEVEITESRLASA